MQVLNVGNNWAEIKAQLEDALSRHSEQKYPLLLDKLYRGEYVMIRNGDRNVNIIGYAYLDNNLQKVFHVMFAWGRNFSAYINQLDKFFKLDHGCNVVSFSTDCAIRTRLYRKIVNKYRYKELLTFSVNLS